MAAFSGIFPRAARAFLRLMTNRLYRGRVWLRIFKNPGAFQPANFTLEDRYPYIFGFVQAQLGAEHKGCILSFGCSSGEEVFSLRRRFPHAHIKGVDINREAIGLARKRAKREADANVEFAVRDSTAGEATASYDAIFCMAVLRHAALTATKATRCDHLIRFEDFARQVADFARCLKPGGFLVMRHSNFRFSDAPAAADFVTALAVNIAPGSETPIFGPDNQLIYGEKYTDTVFRKRNVAQ